MSIVEPPVRPPAPVVVYGVSWKTYRKLRDEPENMHLRMTFDQGRLELMSPSKMHERVAYLLGRMVDLWTEVNDIALQGCRTMTFQRQDLARGLEPDNCFYIQNEPVVRQREELDLTRDPPPDLVIEVDLTSPSRRRLPMYQALGVPEVWVWRADALTVHVLSPSGSYEAQSASAAAKRVARNVAVPRPSGRYAAQPRQFLSRFGPRSFTRGRGCRFRPASSLPDIGSLRTPTLGRR
jgi:Uma2 family endonuclease